MRLFVAAATVAILSAGIADAQYKAPPQPTVRPQTPGAVQMAPNQSVQITPAVNDPELAAARRIPRDEAIKLVKENKAVYIDVRSRDSFDQGHIPGAISIPLTDLQEHYRDLPVKKFLITYCA